MNYTELPEIEIWTRFKEGDIDAFSFIYSRYAEVMLSNSNLWDWRIGISGGRRYHSLA